MAINNENKNEALQEKLQDIKDQEGIIGYILRGSKTASIDLKDPKKIIEYAMLSSTAFDVGAELSDELQMGDLKKILVESENSKFLSTAIDDQRLTIFMEKDVNHNKIYKELK
jgi:predicted regulator of Ras-like GTPase activity (Roadblock/LC7/MglB family)